MGVKEKIKKFVTSLCFFLEVVAAVFVLIGIAIAIMGLIPSTQQFWSERLQPSSFINFLEQILLVVIGVELLKMLCRPSSENILETLIFLVARHVIIGIHTSPVDYLISTVSIILLCVTRRYLHVSKEKEHKGQSDEMTVKDKIKNALSSE